MSALMIVLGVLLIVLTLEHGPDGVTLGLLLGPLFVIAGALRLYQLSRG